MAETGGCLAGGQGGEAGVAPGESLGTGRAVLVLLVLQDEGCWPTARCSSPASGLPATLKRGIGEQTAFPALGCFPRGQQVGGMETEQGKGQWVAGAA